MRVEHVHEGIGIELFNVPNAGTGPFAREQHRRANHSRNTGCVADGLVTSFGKSVLMIADIIDVERFFFAILAKARGDAANVGLALGRWAK